jgi:hypothetical protein
MAAGGTRGAHCKCTGSARVTRLQMAVLTLIAAAVLGATVYYGMLRLYAG